jgi:hypothetical protein
MQPITILGLGLCLAMLYLRARKARNRAPSGSKRRLKTAHVLLGAVLAWLLISIQLRHLNHSLSGDPQAPQTTWERVIQTLSDWGI